MKKSMAKKEAIRKESKTFVVVAKTQMPAIIVIVFVIKESKRNGHNNDSNSLSLTVIIQSLHLN